jgi:hypothetical protein
VLILLFCCCFGFFVDVAVVVVDVVVVLVVIIGVVVVVFVVVVDVVVVVVVVIVVVVVVAFLWFSYSFPMDFPFLGCAKNSKNFFPLGFASFCSFLRRRPARGGQRGRRRPHAAHPASGPHLKRP